MNGMDIVAMLFQWILSTSVSACVIVVLIVSGQKTLGRRLPPQWHYLLWVVLIAKLLMPWELMSPFDIRHLMPEQTLGAVKATFEIASTTMAMAETGDSGSMPFVLSVVWISGFFVASVSIFLANRRFAGKLRKQTAITDPVVLNVFGECRQLMRVRRNIRLVESDLVATPALFGFFRPCLIMPDMKASALRPDQMRYIFLHELAHVRRNDIAMNWIMQILLAVHWFNPVLWYAYSRMRQDQEVACDALVLTRVRPEETSEYGHTLISLFEKKSSPVKIAGIAGLSGNMPQIKKRIIMIRSFRQPRLLHSLLGAALMSMFCFFLLIAVKSTAQASSALPYFPDKGIFPLTTYDKQGMEQSRVIPISTFDDHGVERKHGILVTKENGKWKISFITETGEFDPTMTGMSGKMTIPETGYFSQPGTRDLVFQKGPFDKEWKLIAIQERK